MLKRIRICVRIHDDYPEVANAGAAWDRKEDKSKCHLVRYKYGKILQCGINHIRVS
jgi:hypothetical protein